MQVTTKYPDSFFGIHTGAFSGLTCGRIGECSINSEICLNNSSGVCGPLLRKASAISPDGGMPSCSPLIAITGIWGNRCRMTESNSIVSANLTRLSEFLRFRVPLTSANTSDLPLLFVLFAPNLMTNHSSQSGLWTTHRSGQASTFKD